MRKHAASIAVAAGAVLGCVRMTSFDLPLMLAAGDRLLATGTVPTTNPWHWPHPGWPWLDDKWGFGLLCALAHRVAGPAGLTLLNAALGAALSALVYRVVRRRADPWPAAGIAIAAATVLSYRSMLRAEWISYLGVAWTLLHLEGLLAGSWRRAALVVLAVPLWAACHVYWLLGPVIVLAASVAARSWKGGAAALVAFWAGALSPYGVENLVHPFAIAGGAGAIESGIRELRLPFVSGPLTYLHVLAALAAVQTLLWTWTSWRDGRRPDAVVAALLVVAALRYDRNLALAGLAYAFVAPPVAGDRARRFALHGIVAVPAALGLVLGVGWLAPERSLGLGWDDRAFPTRLLSSLAPEARGARFVNDFSLGSYLDRERGASFIDGNTHGYPPAFFSLYRETLEGTRGIAEIDRLFPNRGWLLRTSAPHTRVLVVGLFLEGDYAPAAWDDVATLFRAEPDPERADDLWRRWLAEVYLPVARTWFADPASLVPSLSALPPVADVGARRALVLANPWHRAFIAALREAHDARGERGPAARLWRLERRL